MKTLLLIIVPLTLLISCDRNIKGEPSEWLEYFNFVTTEESDLFMSYPEYDINKVVYGQFWFTGIPRSFYFVDTVDNIHRFGLANHIMQKESYIYYGNGDIDTLTLSWEPQDVAIEDVFMYKDRPFKAVDKITISFNGTPVVVWDFIANPELKREISLRNNLSLRGRPDYDPIVIILPKEPDWDELD